MLVKIIIVLILTIAVGVLGFSDIGEGVFNFVDKSAAAEFAEDARDLTQIVEIYNTDQQGAQTAFTGTAVAESSTVDAITLGQLSTFLISEDNGAFLKKPVSSDYSLIADVTAPENDAYLRVVVTSVDVCDEINEIAGITSPAPVDLELDELGAMRTAGVDVNEMICVSDDTDTLLNVAYYRLGSAS